MNYRQTPPMPPFTRCVPRGLIGYEEEKQKQRSDALRDRDATKFEALKEAKPVADRLRFINALSRAYPQINVFAIAASISPWDINRFKDAVAEAALQLEM
jgi:hypothetical protein